MTHDQEGRVEDRAKAPQTVGIGILGGLFCGFDRNGHSFGLFLASPLLAGGQK